MNISVKKFSKKSLSLLIALIMVFSALPLTPPISADAAETKTEISVWDASRATTNTASGARYSYKDSQTKKTISGIQWGGLTHNSTYLTVNNSALSIAEISSAGAITGNDSITDKGIRGNKWSFSAKFAYTGSNTKTTVFGLSSTTKRNYSQSNTDGDTEISNGYVADLVDIRADGTVYINNTWSSTVSGISSSDLVATSATAPKTLTVTYDNGNLTIDIDGTQKISQTVDTALFSAGVGNYLAGPNVQVFSGGTAPYYQVTNNGAYLRNFNLYSLSGATYVQEGSQPTPPTNKTVSVVGYGAVKKSGNDRASGTTITIVNDQQDDNFGIGFVNFDISSLSNTEFNVGSANYNMTYSIDSSGREAMGLSFYYATKNDTVFNSTVKGGNLTDTGISSNVYGTGNQHIAKAKTYLGLQKIADVSTHTNATNEQFSVDISPAIRYALSKGKTNCQLLIMLTTAGGEGKYNSSGQSGYWSDTPVTVNTSSVPVTMQTDEDYVKANIGSIKKSYSYLNANNAGTSYMNGIIYGDTWSAADTTEFQLETTTDIHKDKMTMYAYSNSVALYDGSTSIRFPIIYQKIARGDYSTDYDVYQRIEHVALKNNNNSKFSLGNSTWQYCNDTTDFTSKTLTTSSGDYVENISTNISTTLDSNQGDSGGINTAKNDKFQTEYTKNFKNYISYSGTGNDESYYEKFSTPLFDYSADYALFWYNYDWRDRGWKLTMINQKQADISTAFNFYVLNYKPLYDIVKTGGFLETSYNEISNNSSKYSQEGLNNYYAVVADIIDFNLANEPMTSESEVRAVATKIKDLVTRYNNYKSPELKQYTVTIYDLLGNHKETLKVAPGSTINEDNLPKLSSPLYDKNNQQNNQHYIYYWKNSDGTEFTVPYTVNDNVDITESRKIENCNFEVKSISGNTSTVSCSVCNGGTYTLDIEGYNNIVSVAREAINDTVKYDSASRANLETVLNNNNTVNDCLTIEQVNAKISAIQTAITALDLNQYSITFNVVDELGNTTSTVSTNTVDYGTLSILNLPEEYKDYVVTSWKRNINNADSIVGSNMQQLQVIVKSNAVYSVHIKNANQAGTEEQAVITLNNKSNKVADIGYVTMNQDGTETKATVTVDTAAGTIKIGNTTLSAPKYSFYNLTGFEINDNPVANGETITINSKMVIRPVYEAKQSVRITRASDDILINGNDIEFVNVDWNKKIVASTKNGSSVIWKAGVDYDGNGTIEDSEKNVVAYGSTYTFYSNSNVTIYTETSASAPAEPTASIGMFSYDPTDNKVTVVNNFYVPDGMTATNAGVILSTKNGTREALIAQTNGKFEGDESQFTTDKNQIRISVSRTANTSFTMYALAYVVVGNQTYYAPTVQSITYTVTNS